MASGYLASVKCPSCGAMVTLELVIEQRRSPDDPTALPRKSYRTNSTTHEVRAEHVLDAEYPDVFITRCSPESGIG